MTRQPDVGLLSVDWHSRTLLRAQLIEEGFEVTATDSWAAMRERLRPALPLAIVDLQDLPEPVQVLTNLSTLMDPSHVIVLTALNTVPSDTIERLGFHVLKRPVSVSDVAAAALAVHHPNSGGFRL